MKKTILIVEDDLDIQKDINKSREDVSAIVNHLTDWYKSQENEK